MKNLTSYKSSILIKTLLPGLFGLGMMAIERLTTQNVFLQAERAQSNVLNNDPNSSSDNESNMLLALISGVTKTLGPVVFESYTNYFAFMLMMLLVNAFLHGFDILRHLFTKGNSISFVSHWKSFLVDQESLKQTLRSLLRYSLIFCFYQMIWIGLASSLSLRGLDEVTRSPLQNVENVQLEMLLPTRILEQEEITSLAEVSLSDNVKKKPSLSIGKVLGQVDMYAVSIKLSKDGNTAFVATNFPSTLTIIDISDPEYPVVLSTLSLPLRTSDYIFKSILVSPDETKLYISNIADLQVINITNLKSPDLIAVVDDPDSLRINSKYGRSGFAKPNLIISRNEKFLFVSGYGLQIFEISTPASPVLVRSVSSRFSSGYLLPASIALSHDRKTLYYSDGGLWIYNVEDPTNLKVINSFNTTYPITSMILSNDAKTAFTLSQNRQSNILLQKLDVSNISSIKVGKVIRLEQNSTCLPIFLERTPDNLFLMILYLDGSQTTWNQVLIFDTFGEYLLNNKRTLIKNAFAVTFTEDYKRLFVGSDVGKLQIANMYIDFPNKHAFAESKNTIQTFDARCDFFTLSNKNEDSMYCVTDNSLESISFFRIHKLSSSNVSEVTLSETPENILQMVISQDNQRAFWVIQDRIIVMDISNPKNLTKLGEYQTISETLKERVINFLVVSQDGKTGYFTFLQIGENHLEIVDFSDLENITVKSSVKLGLMTDFAMPVLSHDERTVFIMLNKIMVYNVSDPSDPRLLATLSFLEEEYYLTGTSVLGILSPNGKTLFVRDGSLMSQDKVYIIDASNVTSLQIQSSFRLPVVRSDPIHSEKCLLVSADSKMIYIARTDSILVVDVSNLKLPKHLGSIRVLDGSSLDFVRDFSISGDGRKAYVLTKMRKLHIVGIDPVYSTFISQDTLMLGERYSTALQVLKMNEYMNYERIEVDYRFVKFALVERRAIQDLDFEKVVMKVAPSWMNFDLKTQTLSIEARRKNDIGGYQVYFGFSTQIEMDAFSVINGTLKSEDLVAALVALGYLNNQRFLTEDFGELKDFILPSEYSGIKEKIYGILKKYSFGTFNEIQIIESLNVSYSEKFKISTTSGANVKVEISLIGQEAQFLSQRYGSLIPLITGSKSRLIIEGSLKDVNLALQEIVINLPKSIDSCDGEIVIDDKLNPVRIESVKNISKYFNHNAPPGLNKDFSLTIQNQVEKELVWTGLHFQIKLNPLTFFDKYTDVEKLNYQLVFVKDSNETTVLPSWLSFNDMTLMGTAPEEIFNRDFEFKLVVKNEFQEFKVPLKLHVKISSNFVLKLFIKYCPYVLSVVGLLISANKIFNVICKRSYKHPKDFHVRTDEEITSEVIFPVSFIKEEIQEARRILKILERRARNKGEFLSYFMMNGEQKISKLKVQEVIKLSLENLLDEEKKILSLYLDGRGGRRGGGGLHPRELINQIIFNSLTNSLLKSNEERETKRYFEEIKQEWPTFVEWDLTNSAFKINDEKFHRLRQSGYQEESILTNDLRNSFITKAIINVGLLKDAVLAYAFECQNIDIQPLSAQLQVKERIKTNSLKRALKLDLQSTTFCEKGKIGYGIGYTKEYNTLCFNGVVKPDIMKKTIVIQITNLKQKILKELWVYGNFGNEEECGGILDEKSEIEAKGKDYEIF